MNKILIKAKDQAVWIMLVVIVVAFMIAIPNFASPGNFITILRQVSNIGILSVGMTIVLIAGGIDLSIGAVIPLVSVISAVLMKTGGVPMFPAFIVGIVVGLIVGLVNGLVITYTRISPLIMTLGMSYVCKGLAFITTSGYPIYGLPKGANYLGQGYMLGIFPVCVLIMAAVIIFGAVLLNKTQLGRKFYVLGGNEEAARLSGIAVKKTRVIAYTICGFLAGISGIVMMSRLNSGQPLSGNGMEMDALIACVIGGISVAGGEGKATGMIGGMLVMGVLSNGLAVAGMNEYIQQVVKGSVLIVVVAVDSLSRLRRT
jgi:ribose transport system permease protein